MAAVQGAKRTISWSDKSISVLLEALKVRESLWNSKILEYRDRNVKKTQYEEIVAILSEDIPDIDLPAVKGTCQYFCFCSL